MGGYVMIIGISGRVGHGKDTVGKIIQYLAYNEVYKNKSHDAIVDISIAIVGNDVLNEGVLDKFSGWQVRKFAGKLKQIAGIILGVDPSKFESQEYKASYLPEQWDYWQFDEYSTRFESEAEAKVNYHSVDVEYRETLTRYRMTVRQFLQELGTDACRDHIHPKIWINALFADYPGDKYLRFPNWVITDMRFVDEAEAVKKRGGVTIRIRRQPLESYGYTTLNEDLSPGPIVKLHSSETALDDYDFDYVIDNTGTLSDLVEIVKGIMANISEKAV